MEQQIDKSKAIVSTYPVKNLEAYTKRNRVLWLAERQVGSQLRWGSKFLKFTADQKPGRDEFFKYLEALKLEQPSKFSIGSTAHTLSYVPAKANENKKLLSC